MGENLYFGFRAKIKRVETFGLKNLRGHQERMDERARRLGPAYCTFDPISHYILTSRLWKSEGRMSLYLNSKK